MFDLWFFFLWKPTPVMTAVRVLNLVGNFTQHLRFSIEIATFEHLKKVFNVAMQLVIIFRAGNVLYWAISRSLCTHNSGPAETAWWDYIPLCNRFAHSTMCHHKVLSCTQKTWLHKLLCFCPTSKVCNAARPSFGWTLCSAEWTMGHRIIWKKKSNVYWRNSSKKCSSFLPLGSFHIFFTFSCAIKNCQI